MKSYKKTPKKISKTWKRSQKNKNKINKLENEQNQLDKKIKIINNTQQVIKGKTDFSFDWKSVQSDYDNGNLIRIYQYWEITFKNFCKNFISEIKHQILWNRLYEYKRKREYTKDNWTYDKYYNNKVIQTETIKNEMTGKETGKINITLKIFSSIENEEISLPSSYLNLKAKLLVYVRSPYTFT